MSKRKSMFRKNPRVSVVSVLIGVVSLLAIGVYNHDRIINFINEFTTAILYLVLVVIALMLIVVFSYGVISFILMMINSSRKKR